MKENRNLGSWYWVSKSFCPVTVSTGRCLINAKGPETRWWFPEGENVGLITVFLSQDGVDNTKHMITCSRYASDPQQQQPCEWMAHFLSQLSQSGLIRNVWCCRVGLCEILGYTFGKPQSSLRQQKHEEFRREGEVPSEFLACKLGGLFTFIFNIG